MDKVKARKLAKELKGSICHGWEIGDFINNGKSAIVLKSQKNDQVAAIKIFDPDLIEKHGAEIQKERITREKSLIEKKHINLIQIYDGGYWDERKLYFVVMEFLSWKNLADVLKDIPVGKERSIISQIASAAKYLENIEICHRDIKPENIVIDDEFDKVKLLDLGVIRPHGTKPITDGTGGKVFVGTLKYSPPEFLLRKEKDTLEGWRALTFYQIGGVLHDLIMRRSLFSEFENPFAMLVNAVQSEKPEIESNSVSPALVDLANYCLLKKPETRLKLVTWDNFMHEPQNNDQVASIKSRIARRNLAKKESSVDQGHLYDFSEKLAEYTKNIESMFKIECIENRTYWPPIEINNFEEFEQGTIINAQFEPCKTLGISNHFCIQIALEWISPEEEVVAASIYACVSSVPFSKTYTPKSAFASVFTGVYNPDSVWRNISHASYYALEMAMKNNKITNADTNVCKLDLKGYDL